MMDKDMRRMLYIASGLFVVMWVLIMSMCNHVSEQLVDIQRKKCAAMMTYARTAHDSLDAKTCEMWVQ